MRGTESPRVRQCPRRNRMRAGSNVTDWQRRIVLDPAVLAGKPVVKGTRLSVAFILEFLAEGWSESEILDNYPGLTPEDLRACLACASATLDAEKICPIPA